MPDIFQNIEKYLPPQDLEHMQYITNEAKITNDTLLAFQHKSELEIKKTTNDLQANVDTLAKDTNTKL
jgi:hypothetical protein